MSYSKVFFGLALTASMVLTANAFGKDEHPRREEVNRRIRNEERRIDKGVKDGTITPEQATKMRSELAGVKAEEKAEVSANGGLALEVRAKTAEQRAQSRLASDQSR